MRMDLGVLPGTFERECVWAWWMEEWEWEWEWEWECWDGCAGVQLGAAAVQ